METVSRIASIARALPADRIVVDATGVGAGVFDRLRELELPAIAFNGAEGTDRTDSSGVIRFLNKRAAAWWNVRERLHPYAQPPITLPRDPDLLRDLTCPRYKTDAMGGKLAVERKSELMKRLGRSPDCGDAVVLCLWDDDGAYELGYEVHTPETLRALAAPRQSLIAAAMRATPRPLITRRPAALGRRALNSLDLTNRPSTRIALPATPPSCGASVSRFLEGGR